MAIRLSWKEEQPRKTRMPPDPKVSTTASLHRGPYFVMVNDDLSESETSQLFGQIQDGSSESFERHYCNQRIMDCVPVTMQRKAKLLVFMPRDNPDLSLDEGGTGKLYGKPVNRSNIFALFNEVLKQRKRTQPTGLQPFA